MAQKKRNNIDNFTLPCNIDKIFGVLEVLIANNQATRQGKTIQVLIEAKIG